VVVKTSISRLSRLYMFSAALLGIFFLIGTVGGGVQLGPLGTSATNRPIVPVPDDYDDGEIGGMIGRGNRSTWRKRAPVPLCPPQNPTCCPDANPGRRGVKPAINRLSYGTALLGISGLLCAVCEYAFMDGCVNGLNICSLRWCLKGWANFKHILYSRVQPSEFVDQ
jgi:hypothetical protein